MVVAKTGISLGPAIKFSSSLVRKLITEKCITKNENRLKKSVSAR